MGGRQTHLWEDAEGEVHSIAQGEGGEQGDPMMPLLFAVGQHHALDTVSRSLREDERFLAYLDDIYFCCEPDRVGKVYTVVQEALQTHAGIRIHCGKTKVWNMVGERPPVCDVLEQIARVSDPTAHVWRGSGVATERQAIKILGTPVGHPDFVRSHLVDLIEEQHVLLERIQMLQDVQGAWLLLVHCASARANYVVRCVRPKKNGGSMLECTTPSLWECLSRILHLESSTIGEGTRDVATLPLVLGGLGLRSAERTRASAYWASWADCMPMIKERHPMVAELFVGSLEGVPDTPYLREAAEAAKSLGGVMGFEPPSWLDLEAGVRPEDWDPEDCEPGRIRSGWQHEAASQVEQQFREGFFEHMAVPRKALVRSQGGPRAGLPYTTCPTNFFTTFTPQLFRVLGVLGCLFS